MSGTTGYRTCGQDGCEVQQFRRTAAGYCRGETAGSKAWGKGHLVSKSVTGQVSPQAATRGPGVTETSRSRVGVEQRAVLRKDVHGGAGTCKTEVVRTEPGKEPGSKASGPITSDKTRKMWELGAK